MLGSRWRRDRRSLPLLAGTALVAALAAGAAELEPAEPLVPLRQGERWGDADRAGGVVIAPAYDRAEAFVEGLSRSSCPARPTRSSAWPKPRGRSSTTTRP